MFPMPHFCLTQQSNCKQREVDLSQERTWIILMPLLVSLLCREGKQGIKSKAGAIKCCKEIKITAFASKVKSELPFI